MNWEHMLDVEMVAHWAECWGFPMVVMLVEMSVVLWAALKVAT
jgi:hypothetical protein